MSVSAKLEVDWLRNFHYMAWIQSVAGDKTDDGVYRAARSQLKITINLQYFSSHY